MVAAMAATCAIPFSKWLVFIRPSLAGFDCPLTVKPEEKMVETVKPLTVGEALQQKEAARRKPDRGIKPPGNTGHSCGIGI